MKVYDLETSIVEWTILPSVHWHGLILPNSMYGPAKITQAPIEPHQTFVYEFTTQQAGTFFYYSHADVDRSMPFACTAR